MSNDTPNQQNMIQQVFVAAKEWFGKILGEKRDEAALKLANAVGSLLGSGIGGPIAGAATSVAQQSEPPLIQEMKKRIELRNYSVVRQPNGSYEILNRVDGSRAGVKEAVDTVHEELVTPIVKAVAKGKNYDVTYQGNGWYQVLHKDGKPLKENELKEFEEAVFNFKKAEKIKPSPPQSFPTNYEHPSPK